MDDKEYYTMMNRTSPFSAIQSVIKKSAKKQIKPESEVKTWELRQGREDAQMLYEKTADTNELSDN